MTEDFAVQLHSHMYRYALTYQSVNNQLGLLTLEDYLKWFLMHGRLIEQLG